MMKVILFLAVCLMLVHPCYAHPADDPCPPGVTVSFGCQVPAVNLGLNNPAFFAVHKAYWHCRRNLEGTFQQYDRCVGAVNLRHSQTGKVPVTGAPHCVNYHEIIPATPIVEKPGDMNNANLQLLACQANDCWRHVNACWEYLGTID